MENNDYNVLDVAYGRFLMDSATNEILQIDDGFTRITGYTQEDIDNGLIMLEFIPKEDVEYYTQRVGEVLHSKPECYLKHRIVKKSGEKIYVLCFGRVLPDGNSEILIADVTEMVNYEQIVQDVKHMLDTVIENVPSGIAMYEIFPDKHMEVVLANDYYWRTLGYNNESDLLNHAKVLEYSFTKHGYEEISQKIDDMLKDKLFSFENEYKLLRKDGSHIWVSLRFKVYRHTDTDEDKNPIVYAVMSDVTKLKQQLATINYQNERYELIQNLTDEIYFTYDCATDVLSLPKNIETTLTGRARGNTIPNFFKTFLNEKIVHPEDKDTFLKIWNDAFVQKNNGTTEFRIRLYSNTKEYQWCKFHYMVNQDADGNVVGLFGKILDSNENHLLKDEIKRNQDVIEILSSKDTITKLENKTSFCQKFDKILPTLNVKNNCCAIVSADINGFSYINDNFGYDDGNDMLIAYAKLLAEQDFYILNSRIYSDYFYCLAYTNLSREEFLEKVKNINEKFSVQQKHKYPASEFSICAGVYFINNNALNSIICMDNCNLARRSIKNNKTTNICVYSEKLRDNRSREKVVPSELNDAIANQKIELFLQPKFDMKTFKIIGAEALSRWRNDDGSYRSPLTFIPTLERLGYVVQLDFYIYEQVLINMKKWKDNGIELIPISVNFSRIHNNHKNFVDRVLQLADKYTIDRDLIEIEITESAFAESDVALLENIKRLRSLGFKIDIDDFGIGESSLSTLLDVPVDIIKLDKKFIDNLQESRRQQNFLKQLCLLIQTSNKHIIFEGVEQQNQADFLCGCGFYMAQGWLFDKAICVNDFEKKYIHDKKFS